MKTIQYEVLGADEGRIDALVARLVGFSRARVRGLVDHGGVSLNGVDCCNPATPVHRADRVGVRFDPERRYREKPPERATHGFNVVFLDDQVVVVNKDAGLLTVPTAREERNTLVDRLSAHLAKGRSDKRRVSVVHRLDRETSGLLVFGRTPADARALIAEFAARKPERQYAALVAGRIEADGDEIRSHLATDRALNQKSVDQRSGRPGGNGGGLGPGELAITHFEVEQRFADATLIKVWLETGRRNQIRVHMAERGHPVLGDQRYRPERAAHPAWPYERLALHARVLGFRHPADGKRLRFEAPLPGEFAEFVRRSGKVKDKG